MFSHNWSQHSQLVQDGYDSPLVLALEIDCKYSQCLYACIISMYGVCVHVCCECVCMYVLHMHMCERRGGYTLVKT